MEGGDCGVCNQLTHTRVVIDVFNFIFIVCHVNEDQFEQLIGFLSLPELMVVFDFKSRAIQW